MKTGTASIHIDRAPAEVFAAIADVTRMGDWSPECLACRWVAPADGPAVGARFEGDNKAGLGPITLKTWTTTSEITACIPGEVFEFVAEEMTTWRYEFAADGAGTRVTESFSFAAQGGFQGFLYERVMRRSVAMTKGMAETLSRVKAVLEA